MVFFRPILQLLVFLYLRYNYSCTLCKWKKKISAMIVIKCGNVYPEKLWELLSRSPQLGKTLSKLIGLESWLCSEQEPGPDGLQRMLLP